MCVLTIHVLTNSPRLASNTVNENQSWNTYQQTLLNDRHLRPAGIEFETESHSTHFQPESGFLHQTQSYHVTMNGIQFDARLQHARMDPVQLLLPCTKLPMLY